MRSPLQAPVRRPRVEEPARVGVGVGRVAGPCPEPVPAGVARARTKSPLREPAGVGVVKARTLPSLPSPPEEFSYLLKPARQGTVLAKGSWRGARAGETAPLCFLS